MIYFFVKNSFNPCAIIYLLLSEDLSLEFIAVLLAILKGAVLLTILKDAILVIIKDTCLALWLIDPRKLILQRCQPLLLIRLLLNLFEDLILLDPIMHQNLFETQPPLWLFNQNPLNKVLSLNRDLRRKAIFNLRNVLFNLQLTHLVGSYQFIAKWTDTVD